MLGVWWLGMSYEAFGVVTHANDFGKDETRVLSIITYIIDIL